MTLRHSFEKKQLSILPLMTFAVTCLVKFGPCVQLYKQLLLFSLDDLHCAFFVPTFLFLKLRRRNLDSFANTYQYTHMMTLTDILTDFEATALKLRLYTQF